MSFLVDFFINLLITNSFIETNAHFFTAFGYDLHNFTFKDKKHSKSIFLKFFSDFIKKQHLHYIGSSAL